MKWVPVPPPWKVNRTSTWGLATMEMLASRLQFLPAPPDNPPHKTMETSGHPPVPCPSATLPLPLSPCVSCHLSMKECQARSLAGQSDWHFLLFRFSACFKRVASNVRQTNRKDYPPHRLSSRCQPLVSHLPVSIV